MKYKKLFSLFMIGILSVVFTTNCATILKGDMEKVHLQSEPGDAQVFINGEYYGRTPLKIKLKCYNSYVIEYKKKGYKTITKRIENKIGAGYIVLDVIFGFVPIIVDAITGAWYKLDQHYVNALLEKQQP